MARVSTAQAPFGAETIHAIVTGISALFDRYNRWEEQRKTREVLAQLTPDQLEDIGLTEAAVSEMFLIRG
ncbi:MAG: DUF1127 domain-containing protein [Pseudomonadota bacterium]